MRSFILHQFSMPLRLFPTFIRNSYPYRKGNYHASHNHKNYIKYRLAAKISS